MEIGDRVISYTHESMDNDHSTVDRLAFVTGIANEDLIDVVVFPPGGPTEYYRVSRFDPDNPGDAVGWRYWREHGEDAPDFASAFAHVNDPDWLKLRESQKKRLDAAVLNPAVTPAEVKDIEAEQKRQRDELRARLDKAYSTPKPTPDRRPV